MGATNYNKNDHNNAKSNDENNGKNKKMVMTDDDKKTKNIKNKMMNLSAQEVTNVIRANYDSLSIPNPLDLINTTNSTTRHNVHPQAGPSGTGHHDAGGSQHPAATGQVIIPYREGDHKAFLKRIANLVALEDLRGNCFLQNYDSLIFHFFP